MTVVRFWDALWRHQFYVRIFQVITPLSVLDPSPSVFFSLLEDEELRRILINVTEAPGDFVARKRFEDKSLLQVLIKFNCINLFSAGIIVLL